MDISRMNKLVVDNANNNKEFTPIGNDFAYLVNFTREGFIIKPYYETDHLEYDFNGDLLRKITEQEYEESRKHKGSLAWMNGFDKFKNVVEVYGHDEEYGNTHHGQLVQPRLLPMKDKMYNNQSDFQTTIDKMGDAPKVTSVGEWVCGNIKLTRWSCDKPLFIVSDTKSNNIISVAGFDNDHFLDGDAGTHVYVLNEKNILMWNDGDHPSVLLFRNNSETLKLSNPIPKKMMAEAKMLETTFANFRQLICNLLYLFYDEGKYQVYLHSNGSMYSIMRRTNSNKPEKEVLCAIHSGNGLNLTKVKNGLTLTVHIDNITHETIEMIHQWV